MKFIVICCLVLALGLSSNGDSDWKQFNDEIRSKLCDPDKTDDTVLTAMAACKMGMNKTDRMNKLFELCGTPNEDDIKAYSKVTIDTNKKILMAQCSDKMRQCIKKKIKEMKASGQLKKPDSEDSPKLSHQQKDDFKNCLKKAVGL